MGPLNTIFATVNPLITANLADASISPSYGTTGRERAMNAAPPRICWVPTTEDIRPPMGQGGDIVRDSANNMTLPSGANPPIATRICNVECDLWGDDRDKVEVMINAVDSAVHDAMVGSYGVLGARWLKPEETSKRGEIYRFTFQFMIPILRVTPQTQVETITAIPQTPQFVPLVAS